MRILWICKFYSGGILMKKYTIFSVCLILFLSAGCAYAQPLPPGPQGPTGQFNFGVPEGQFGYGNGWTGQPVTVVQARTYGHQAPILIRGTLVQFYSAPDNYVFRDSTGDIIVKIGPKEWEYLWYQNISIGPGDTIEIYGEVHWPRHSWGIPEIHARFIRVGSRD
jgi:uncharacterized protein (TIGR00156 family)